MKIIFNKKPKSVILFVDFAVCLKNANGCDILKG